MSNEINNMKAPKLRFKDYSELFFSAELKSLVEKDRKIRYGIVQPGKFDPTGRLMVRGQDYSTGWANPKDVFRVSDEIESRYANARIKEGDLLMTIVGFTGLIERVPIAFDGANITQTTARIAIDESIAVPDYIKYFFLSKPGRSNIEKFTKGLAQPGLNIADVEKFKIILTSYAEQQKIAACLSSLDEVITAESKKLEVLQDHKKGLLQNLLTQAEETVPKIRFKEFEDSGEWQETTLSQVADYENGKAHEQDIADDGEFIVVNSKFISQDGEVKKFTNTAFLPATKGDVLMVLSDIPNGKAIAKCFLVEEDNRYTVNQRICRITPRNVNSKILYYLLNRNPYFLAFDDGVKQTNLRKDDVLNCPLLIPEDPKEQEKIAETLSSIDELITAQSQKLEALQLHKKGLLQGLFPNLNEVTV